MTGAALFPAGGERDDLAGQLHTTLGASSAAEVAAAAQHLAARLTTHLVRFAGDHQRFDQALRRAQHDPAWITATDRDSCDLVWFQLHEDLLATLGLAR